MDFNFPFLLPYFANLTTKHFIFAKFFFPVSLGSHQLVHLVSPVSRFHTHILQTNDKNSSSTEFQETALSPLLPPRSPAVKS